MLGIFMSVFGILIFALLGIYSAIVRSFNEDYLLRILIGHLFKLWPYMRLKN
jgi:hypothetical protein